MPSVLVFDVNGTLLDVHALEPRIRRIFGNRYSVREWFVEVVQYSMAMTLAGEYRPFSDVAMAVLVKAAAACGLVLDPADIDSVRDSMGRMPAFPGARRALARLYKAGFRLATLSNSELSASQEVLSHSGLREYLDHVLSVQMVQQFKPAPEVYRAAAEVLDEEPGELLMISAHAWDLMGAAKAGLQTAWVARPGEAPLPGTPASDYRAANLDELADQLIGRRRSQPLWGHSGRKAVAAGALAMGVAGALLAPKLRRASMEERSAAFDPGI